MATKDSKTVPSDTELREILGKERGFLETICNEKKGWTLYKNYERAVAEKNEELSVNGSIVFKFVSDYESTKAGEIAKDQLHEILWTSSFEQFDEDIEEKKIIYTNEDKTLQVKYLREKFPWPCEKRDYVTAYGREQTENGSIVWGAPVDYGVPPMKKVVRGRESFVCIVEGSAEESKCKMTSVYTFNAGGWIPGWMLKLGIEDMLTTMLDMQKLM